MQKNQDRVNLDDKLRELLNRRIWLSIARSIYIIHKKANEKYGGNVNSFDYYSTIFSFKKCSFIINRLITHCISRPACENTMAPENLIGIPCMELNLLTKLIEIYQTVYLQH